MQTRNIVIIEAKASQRLALKKLLEKESFEVFDFDNSMSAILWLKKNDIPAGILIENQAVPLDAAKTTHYIYQELKIALPILITVEPKSYKFYEDLPEYIIKPFNAHSVLRIMDVLEKPVKTGKNEPKTPIFSLQYLEEIYDKNEELILESLRIFQSSVAIKLEDIKGLLDHREYDEIRKVAHNIKPSFEMLNNIKGSALCHKLVYESSDEEINSMMEDLNKEFKEINSELSIYFAQTQKEYS